MNVSVTIPQLFYDLIARVIPGFVFLVALNLELSGTGYQVIKWPTSSDSSMAVIFNSLGYCILCYVIGWVLLSLKFCCQKLLPLALKFCGLKKGKVKDEPKAKSNLESDSPLSSEMFQWIRLENEAAGFRLAKLRAEARMLETSWYGMVCILLFTIVILILRLILDRNKFIPCFQPSVLGWILRFFIPVVIVVAFWIREKRAWEYYYKNIEMIYNIMLEMSPRTKQ